jgi:hypothetical protein
LVDIYEDNDDDEVAYASVAVRVGKRNSFSVVRDDDKEKPRIEPNRRASFTCPRRNKFDDGQVNDFPFRPKEFGPIVEVRGSPREEEKKDSHDDLDDDDDDDDHWRE